MTSTIIPAELLQKSHKILFIAHLALGDFTYLQNFFQAYARTYPHLKIHLWVDEVRRTSDASQWPYLEKYSLYDWVKACPFFEKIYTRTYSPTLYRESITQAQQEHYPIVVSLATLRPHLYAGLARSISPAGFVAGMKNSVKFFQPHHQLAYRKLNAIITPFSAENNQPHHITDVYAHWFQQLGGAELSPAERFPFVLIPEQWLQYAQHQLTEWNFRERNGKLIFINPYAKTKKRSWSLENVADLIQSMQKQSPWADACFIVNAVPQELTHARQILNSFSLKNTQLFSAEENFFQLPAMLTTCDLIISVETAVMHLANAVKVPVIALMRQKNPEWVPFDHANSTIITAPHRRDWVKSISVKQVMEVLQ